MGSTMKAAVVTEFNQPLQIKDVDIPKVSAGKVLVKMIATGVCHTDLHAMHGDYQLNQVYRLSQVMKAWVKL